MDISALQFVGAFLAACLVLAIAWATEGLDLRWHPKRLKPQFSLGALIILVTVFAGCMTLVAAYLTR